MINVGIIGVTGYAGEELIAILLAHPQVTMTNLSAKIDSPQHIASLFPKFKGRLDLTCTLPDIRSIIASCDLVFLALPHTVSMDLVPALMADKRKVIDLSADYRLKDVRVYEKYYAHAHKDTGHIVQAVYGLPELYRESIKGAQLIANPGCYPTAATLSLAPLVACCAEYFDLDAVVIDAKSGATGAGRKAVEGLLFSEINQDFKAYKVNVHQHAPEIDQELSNVRGAPMKVVFVPHLLPVNRGILETVYVKKTKELKSKGQLFEVYKKFYKQEPFVRIKEAGSFPRLRDVVGTNFCDIGIQEEGDTVIIISAIDNLLKGASGQAVQNMNIMYGFPESAGLL